MIRILPDAFSSPECEVINPLAPTLGGIVRNLRDTLRLPAGCFLHLFSSSDTPKPSAKGLRFSPHPCPQDPTAFGLIRLPNIHH